MAWIKMIDDDEADGDLEEMYKKYGGPSGGLDHILRIHSLDPPSLQLHYDYYKHVMTSKCGLNRTQREMIGIVVSDVNECHY